ncbi:MAG: (Fe-S)-binding protein [Dehalococcoidia bacterium]|nr:(Fe-S)-binding protein [Dehalococcoidia bacterium]
MKKNERNLVPPGLSYIADNIGSRDNILGLPVEARAKWAEGIEFSRDKSTIFFAGCGYQYSSMLEPLVTLVRTADRMSIDPDLPVVLAGIPKKMGVDVAGIYTKVLAHGDGGDSGVLRDAVGVLKYLGISVGYLGVEEPCCGAPLYHMGLRREFAVNAGKTVDRFRSHGVRKIVSIVPSCTHALRTLFAPAVPGYDIEVRHFIEEVADKIRPGQFRYPHNVKVAYHDPCQLGRYMGLIEQPRRILRAVENVELTEPEWTSGEWSTCCGGGGGFEVVFPDMSQMLAEGRIRELADTGADVIATQCPGCLMQLKSGLKALKKDKIEVIDLATLLARSMNTK